MRRRYPPGPEDRWYEKYGEYPFLVLGFRRDEHLFCLDCAQDGDPVLAGDDDAEHRVCRGCGDWLRHAKAFGSMSQADLAEVAADAV